MLDARCSNLIRVLDSYLDKDVQVLIKRERLTLVYQFDGPEGLPGELRLYKPLLGAANVNPQTDWFYKRCLWLREAAPYEKQPWEAYIEYESDFRDPICVDLRSPIKTLRVPSMMQTVCQKLHSLVAKPAPEQMLLFG